MTAAAFDTLKLAEHLHGAGFTKKQASGLAEGLASALADHPRRDVVIEAIQDSAVNVTRRIDATERRVGGQIEELKSGQDAKFDAIGTILAKQGETLTNHGQKFDNLETMLAKILEGQAVLLQNDMELKRRLDRKG